MKQSKSFFLLALLVITISTWSQQPVSTDSSKIDSSVFAKVEVEADFPGGVMAWRKYLEKNLNPNTPVDHGASVGKYTVITEFIVDKDGSISNIKSLTRLGYGMEQEVLRIIRNSGAWAPAMINNKPVKAYRKQPVTFVVQEDGFDIITKEQYVLYTGADNELTVEVRKVKPDDLSVTISQGTITPAGNGKFIARVSKPGRALVDVYKKSKKIGTVNFEVTENK